MEFKEHVTEDGEFIIFMRQPPDEIFKSIAWYSSKEVYEKHKKENTEYLKAGLRKLLFNETK